MISKIIFRKRKILQLIASFLGAFTGFLLLLVSVQFYSDIRNILESKNDLLGSDYIVIRKNISGTSTITGKQPLFSDRELESIRKQPFVEEIGEFIPGRFTVYVIFPGLGGEQGMETFAFVEAVPDKFIDVLSDEWKWEEGEQEVPVILPTSYMDSYNFGFAPGLGLPPVSEGVFKKMKLFIQIEGNGKSTKIIGNIAGFSDRINTILVPLNFVQYANPIFENREASNPARLILAVKDLHDPALAKFLDDNAYDANTDSLRGSRVKSVLEVTLTVFFILGLIILLLSLHSFVQYSQILISDMSYELKVLLLLGYRHTAIAGQYIRYYLVLMIMIAIAAIACMIVIKNTADSYLETYNLGGSEQVLPMTWLTGSAFLLFMILLTAFSIFRQVKGLAKNLQGTRG
jgi:hypothetical protein